MFALLAIAAPSVLSWVAYRGVSRALETEFARRLEGVAAATATQISADDIADARLLGEDGSGYGTLQVQLEELRATTGLENASLFDSARQVIYDCRGAEFVRAVTRLDTLVHNDVSAALAGRSGVSAAFTLGARAYRAGFAPVVSDGGHIPGVVAVEARLDYLDVLAGVGRGLLITWLVLTAAIAAFALLFLRAVRGSERLERQLARSETLAAMGRLTASLAHEIKNPLAIIRGSAQRLGKLEPEAGRMADFVVEEADRLSKTVARYLQFARGDEVVAGMGDATASLAATVALLEGEALQRNVRVDWPEPHPPAPVALDNECLKQIYLNLMLNAMEAMPDGGAISIAMATHMGRTEVRITDQGPGLTEQQLQQLGAPFQTSKAQGSGLGLFLSRRLAQSVGGTLELHNAPGGGAQCVLRIPVRRDS